MFQRLIKKTSLAVEDRTFSGCYYEPRTTNGASRYYATVRSHPEDHIILDTGSVHFLKTQLASLVHASIDSDMLIGTDSVVLG